MAPAAKLRRGESARVCGLPNPMRDPVKPVFLFDLDNTLHDASHAIFGQINQRMTAYVREHLGLDPAQADALRVRYWQRYGATLMGLVRHHGVRADHFLRTTHDMDLPALVQAERGLTRLFARLPGRKVLVTNAPDGYAAAVVRHLGLHAHLARRYTIESMRVHGSYRPKPSRAMLRHLLARERVPAWRAVLVEDTAVNLKAARAVGLRTVLVTHGSRSAGRRRARPGYVDLRLRSVLDLPRRLSALRRGGGSNR
ncbi:MAG: pyrimidine 5'-nucleotidase [Burkholderiales bacterium]|jgi:putative hydrolase of the HAD superfamily|nr:pyrimidine 5'-nucleotidase [Burkholderiales bacterium]